MRSPSGTRECALRMSLGKRLRTEISLAMMLSSRSLCFNSRINCLSFPFSLPPMHHVSSGMCSTCPNAHETALVEEEREEVPDMCYILYTHRERERERERERDLPCKRASNGIEKQREDIADKHTHARARAHTHTHTHVCVYIKMRFTRHRRKARGYSGHPL